MELSCVWLFVLVLAASSSPKGVLCKRTNPKMIHHLMTENELKRIFGVESHDEVPEYDVTHPYQSTPEGKFVSHDLRSNHRIRRNTDSSDEHHYSLKAFGKTLHLNLRENKDLIAPGLVLESYADGKVKRTPLEPSTHYIGRVRDHPESTVAISNHGALSGLIQLQDHAMIVQPLPRRFANKLSKRTRRVSHLIYKYNVKRSADSTKCGTDTVKKSTFERLLGKRHNADLSRMQKRGGSVDYRIEYAMIADEQVKALHENSDNATAEYLLQLANIMSGLFHDNSIGDRKVAFVVTKLFILTNDEFGVAANVDAHAKMSGLINWTNTHYPKPTDGSSDTIPFESISLVHKGGSLIGLASVGNLCGSRFAPSLSADVGLQTAFKLCHEIAHNMGIPHDDDFPECLNGYLMTSTVSGGSNYFRWSNCSKVLIQKYLSGPSASCLGNTPTGDRPVLSYVKQTTLPGLLVDGDGQCKYQYGSAFYRCTQHYSNCASLYCSENGVQCHSYSAPPMDGTACGVRHWCLRGLCVDNGSPRIDGGWTAWSSIYSSCGQSCDGGVQHKTRTCTNPAPKNDGNSCEGAAEGQSLQRGNFRICNSEACPANTQSYRDIQCKAKNSNSVEYITSETPCALKCKQGSYVYNYGTVNDGTRCSNDPFNLDVCVEGKCRAVGCDHVLDSTAKLDRCGICQGDGSTCKLVQGTYTKNYRSWGVDNPDTISTLPVGTTNVHYEKKGLTYNLLGISYPNGTKLIGLPTWSKTVYKAGAKIIYNHDDNQYKDTLDITGPPTTHELIAQFIWIYETNQGIDYHYYEPSDVAQVAPGYQWKALDWSSCTTSCAGGVQTRSVYCLRTDDNTTVDDSSCNAAEKPAHERACNTAACPAEWYLSPWSQCSKTCGKGSQSRSLTCRRMTNSSNYETLLDSACAAGSKPSENNFNQNCGEVACEPQWKPQSWSACSTTCGQGVSTRQLICVRIDETGTEKTVSTDLCNAAPKPSTSQKCNEDNPCEPPEKIQIACYNANPNPLEETLGNFTSTINWDHTEIVVGQCGQLAFNKKYSYFAVGNNGICYSGPNTKTLYYNSTQNLASANDCSNGVGRAGYIFAYTFVPLPPLTSLGCFQDKAVRALPVLYAYMRNQINWKLPNKTIQECANVARDKSYSYFGIQFYGECWSAEDSIAETAYKKYGAASNCWEGLGGNWSNMVYKFGTP